MLQPMSRQPWLIYGARSFALTVADLIEDTGARTLGMIDDTLPSSAEADSVFTFTAAVERFAEQQPSLALGIGYRDLAARWRAWQRLRELGWPMPSLVHPEAYVARTAHVEEGAIVMARAIVDRNARIEQGSVVWPGACVSHDSSVGVNCFVSPGAIICGHVRVGAHSFVGAGALIADGCNVPESSFLKMGSRHSERRAHS